MRSHAQWLHEALVAQPGMDTRSPAQPAWAARPGAVSLGRYTHFHKSETERCSTLELPSGPLITELSPVLYSYQKKSGPAYLFGITRLCSSTCDLDSQLQGAGLIFPAVLSILKYEWCWASGWDSSNVNGSINRTCFVQGNPLLPAVNDCITLPTISYLLLSC